MEYVSEEGLSKLKQELNELKTARRKDIAVRLEHAKSLGDLSENAEYQEAKEEQSLLESEIAELEETIRNAVLIQKTNDTDRVRVGSTIRVNSVHGDETFTIVGSEEADPVGGKISNESPLGKSFLNRKPGDKVEVKTPGGLTLYEIAEIQ
ncbi:MAG: transcription elongation factor GreA [Candidatus Sungbacteria bacterium]|nr:transcription elongation factor GreA [Candidatus Sungbacteria bacterium]